MKRLDNVLPPLVEALDSRAILMTGNQKVYEHAKRAVERLVQGDSFWMPTVNSTACAAITCKMVPDADNAYTCGTKHIDGYTVETTHEQLPHMYGGIWKEYVIKQKI